MQLQYIMLYLIVLVFTKFQCNLGTVIVTKLGFCKFDIVPMGIVPIGILSTVLIFGDHDNHSKGAGTHV